MTSASGWGSGAWGAMPWGAGAQAFGVDGASAVRENLVRVRFNSPLWFSRTLELGDASDPERYSVSPIEGTHGYDGSPARSVLVARVDLVVESLAGGKMVDLWLDRPLSHWPARYAVATNNVRDSAGNFIDIARSVAIIDGLQFGPPPMHPAAAVGTRDLSCPQSIASLGNAMPGDVADRLLGTYPSDATGDLAYDEGLAGYRKRVLRRLMVRKGAFAHLRDYGVGVPGVTKRLASASIRESVAADAESQVKLEPETISASCWFEVDPRNAGLWWLRVRAKTMHGSLDESVPFQE